MKYTCEICEKQHNSIFDYKKCVTNCADQVITKIREEEKRSREEERKKSYGNVIGLWKTTEAAIKEHNLKYPEYRVCIYQGW